METITIDLNKIRKALPNRASVVLKRTDKGTVYLECEIKPALDEYDFKMVIDWQREIIGADNIMEFYTEIPGRWWKTYLIRKVYEFDGVNDEDINSIAGMNLVKDGALIK